MNGFALFDVSANYVEDGRYFGLSSFNQSVHIFFKLLQLVGNGGIQCYHCAGTVGIGPYGAELETVSGECERRSAVTVRVINQQFRNLRDIQLHALFVAQADQVILRALFDVLQYLRKLFAQKEEMMAGGASLAPNRWALVALEMDALSSPLW